MIRSKKSIVAEHSYASRALRKRRACFSALLFIILLALLVSACGRPSPEPESTNESRQESLDTGVKKTSVNGQQTEETLQESLETGAENYLETGEKLLEDSQYEQAVDAFRKAIEEEPDSIPARIGLAKAYIGLNKLDEAQSFLLEVLAPDPDNIEAIEVLSLLSKEKEEILFIHGLLAARDDDGKWGYIDKTGAWGCLKTLY